MDLSEMEQQDNFFKMDFIDLSTSWSNESNDQNQSSVVWNEEPKEFKISNEELKIRRELEIEIENNLEEEIKQGIWDLALRLHRLYQHKKERIARELSTYRFDDRNTIFRGMHIMIRVEGGSKVEIKEIEKEKRQLPKISLLKAGREIDWVRSLRSLNKKCEKSRNGRAQRKICVSSPNKECGKHERKKCSNAPRNKKDEELKLRNIGWQS
ncbi:hypothetical protein ACHQM5_016303 [Ranunculus cassubicifolius]